MIFLRRTYYTLLSYIFYFDKDLHLKFKTYVKEASIMVKTKKALKSGKIYPLVNFDPLKAIKLMRRGESLVRMGDGEFMCMQEHRIGEESFFGTITDEKLHKEMINCYLNTELNIAIPSFRRLEVLDEKISRYHFMSDNKLLKLLATRNDLYSISIWDHIFQYSRYKNIFEVLRIDDNKKVLYITNNDNIKVMKILSDDRKNNFYLQTPKEKLYDEIEDYIIKIEEKIKELNNLDIILLSIGMNSCIVINRLYKKYPNIQFIDYGQAYSRFQEKKAIKKFSF